MSRTGKHPKAERIERLIIQRVEGMWVVPAYAVEAGEKAYAGHTVNQLHEALDAFLDAYLDGMAAV